MAISPLNPRWGRKPAHAFVLASFVRHGNFTMTVCGIVSWWENERKIPLSLNSRLLDSLCLFYLLWGDPWFPKSSYISRIKDRPPNWEWWLTVSFGDSIFVLSLGQNIMEERSNLVPGFRGLDPSSVHPFGNDVTANQEAGAQARTVQPWGCVSLNDICLLAHPYLLEIPTAS